MLKVLTKVIKYAKAPALIALSLAVGAGIILPKITLANGNPGLTIFSGVDRKDILDYFLQFGGRSGSLTPIRTKSDRPYPVFEAAGRR